MKYIITFLLACLVFAIGTSVYIYDQHRHTHQEEHEGEVYRKDDVVMDAWLSFNRGPREKVICYRESHRNFYVFIFQLSLVILALTTYGVVIRTRLNKKLKLRNDEVLAQKKEIDDANQMLQSSLRYAGTLQSSILDSAAELTEAIPGSFVLNMPRDGLGGDFFYVHHQENGIWVCLGDCTGHGVPGGLLSVLGYTLLKNKVESGKASDPAHLLNGILTEFALRINQHSKDLESTQSDSIEMMVCFIETASNKLTYASNGGTAYFSNGAEGIELKADRRLVGIQSEIHCRNYEVDLTPGMLYLYSDGVFDQLGGTQAKRLGRKKYLEKLTSICGKTESEQIALINYLESWQSGEPQTDDILVLGLPVAGFDYRSRVVKSDMMFI